LPQRAWVLATGLRRLDFELLRLSVARGDPRSEEALLHFVARRLARRKDEGSLELLQRWQQGDEVVRQRAAAAVLGD